MDIRGEFADGRPQMQGRLLFANPQIVVEDCTFVLDTGADRTLWMPGAEDVRAGVDYRRFAEFPPSSTTGFGGSFIARIVPATLLLISASGEASAQVILELEVVRRTPDLIDLPSVLGRDVLDLFRLTIDRSTGLIALTDAEGDVTSDRWPDGELRE
jgi:hypothetical protein